MSIKIEDKSVECSKEYSEIIKDAMKDEWKVTSIFGNRVDLMKIVLVKTESKKAEPKKSAKKKGE